MIKNIYNDQIFTANEAAKLLVWNSGHDATYWAKKNDYFDTHKMTKKEIEALDKAIEKHIWRVFKFLRQNKLAKQKA